MAKYIFHFTFSIFISCVVLCVEYHTVSHADCHIITVSVFLLENFSI